MLDFNDAGPQFVEQPPIDLDALSAALRRTVHAWAPRLFPNGRKVDDVLRLANIRGDAPRKNGSCVIHLKGPHAGDWFDFDGNVGGGPLSTVAESTGLEGRALLSFAAELAGILPSVGGATRTSTVGTTRVQPEGATEREITFILSRAAPLPGTHAEAYLRARGLDTTNVDDLLFHPDLAHFQTRAGYPALVAVARDHAGEPVGLHRIWLDPRRRDPIVSGSRLRRHHGRHRDRVCGPHRASRPAGLGRDRGRALGRMSASRRPYGNPDRGRS
jgi:hypothetical protein